MGIVATIGFSGTVEVYGVKIGIFSQLNDLGQFFDHKRSGSLFDHCPRPPCRLKPNVIFNLMGHRSGSVWERKWVDTTVMVT